MRIAYIINILLILDTVSRVHLAVNQNKVGER